MTQSMAAWTAPQCPFRIEYATDVLEGIRLAVMDAFFSLPRGGAEIGGILLGKPDRGRVTITGYVPLECEHAFGPSFVLSPNDHRRLSETLAAHRRGQGGTVAVGWYHSHTRSEIFLTEVDLEIHERYFPEVWQVALVLKPHAFQPMRGGFFFREEGGAIRIESSYQEFRLEGATVKRPAGAGDPASPARESSPVRPFAEDPMPSRPADDRAAARAIARKLLDGVPAFETPVEPEPAAPEYEFPPQPPVARWEPQPPIAPVRPQPEPEPEPVLQAEPEPEPHIQPEPEPEIEPEAEPVVQAAAEPDETPAAPVFKAPEFLMTEPKQSRRWLTIAIALVGGLGLGAIAYQTREMWLPRITGLWHSGSDLVAQPAFAGLQTVDLDGQLQIRWDRNSAAVQGARDGTLIIRDAGTPLEIELDKEHLLAGSFTYGRQGERVDITLALHGPGGQVMAREASTYLGKLPARPPAEDSGVKKERDDLVKKADSLTKDLDAQRARTQKLEKSLEDIKTERRLEQRRRLENQTPDK